MSDEFRDVRRSQTRTARTKEAKDMTEHAQTNPLAPMAATADRRRWMALYVLCVGMLMIVLDATVVNVALPTIQDDLGFSQSGLAWVVNAYLIAFGGLLLLAGRFGDILGRKSVFLAGLGVFTLASLMCGVAQSQEVLCVRGWRLEHTGELPGEVHYAESAGE